MERHEAFNKWNALRMMTVERGCFPGEAETAQRLAAKLDRQWGFSNGFSGSTRSGSAPQDERTRRWSEYVKRTQQRPQPPKPKPSAEQQRAWSYEYESARMKWKWEGRKCGDPSCWCSHESGMHGPYRYGKKRTGRRVKSIYLGRGTETRRRGRSKGRS